ncbi:MAG: YkgJ family cysteine cluster protein [Eubacteriales bacterium]
MIKKYKKLFQEYEALAAEADQAFLKMSEKFGAEIKCETGCADCCHSVFGLFLIESAYLNYHVGSMDEESRREAVSRGDESDRELEEVQKKLLAYDHDLEMKARAMAAERVRCPLLGEDDKCALYPFRPVTCRVYGIPAIIGGMVRACWKCGYEEEKDYPAYNLDGVYRKLYRLSQRLLEEAGRQDIERASLLVSVSQSIRTPVEGLFDIE